MGSSTRTETDFITSDIIYKDGKREGLAKFYYQSGQVEREVSYRNDKRDGLVRYYEENGKLAGEGTYLDNLPQDGFIRGYHNGYIVEGFYEDGKMHGLTKFYSYKPNNSAFEIKDQKYKNNLIYTIIYKSGEFVSGSCTDNSYVLEMDNNGVYFCRKVDERLE
jgi:antitoxin component YwqK of YwqJK toxin-antitoxin module